MRYRITYRWFSINEIVTKDVSEDELQVLEKFKLDGKLKIIKLEELKNE